MTNEQKISVVIDGIMNRWHKLPLQSDERDNGIVQWFRDELPEFVQLKIKQEEATEKLAEKRMSAEEAERIIEDEIETEQVFETESTCINIYKISKKIAERLGFQREKEEKI